jgi:hypothetical protein
VRDITNVNPPALVRRADDLAALAVEINREHAAGEESMRRGQEHYRKAGELLLRAKDACVRQQQPWLEWLGKNCKAVGERQAQKYMRLALNWDEISSKPDFASDMALEECLNLVGAAGEAGSVLALGPDPDSEEGLAEGRQLAGPAEGAAVPDPEPYYGEEISGSATGREPDPDNNPEDRKLKGKGIFMAHEAIDILMRIPPDDALRVAGLKTVLAWVRRALGVRHLMEREVLGGPDAS